MSLIIPILLASVTIILLSYVLKKVQLLMQLSWIPGPPPTSILTSFVKKTSPEDSFQNMKDCYRKYGKIFKIWNHTTPLIFCQDLETIQLIFKENGKTSRPMMYNLVREYIGPGLLFGEADERWQIHRKYLNEAFHSDVLDKNVTSVWTNMHSFIDILKLQLNRPINLIDYTREYFLRVTIESVIGLDSKSVERQELIEYLDAIESMSQTVMARLFSPVLKVPLFFNASKFKSMETQAKTSTTKFVRSMISRRSNMPIKENSKTGEKRVLADIMLSMLGRDEVFKMTDIEDQVSNHLLASYDTMSATTSLLLYQLSINPQIQEAVIKEIDSVTPNILQEKISMKDLSRMTLLDRCLKEILRMYPSAPMIGRRLNQPFVTKQGTLPAGVEVYINLHTYHLDEDVFPDAEKFDPDRFLPERMIGRHPLTWMPFGMGVRSCIGQKTATVQCKAAAAMLLKAFAVESVAPPRDLKLVANLVINSSNGVNVILKNRTSKP